MYQLLLIRLQCYKLITIYSGLVIISEKSEITN